MNGRRLYDHHVDALAANQRRRWNGSTYALVYPAPIPPAWPFLDSNQQTTWNDLAKRITPKPRKR